MHPDTVLQFWRPTVAALSYCVCYACSHMRHLFDGYGLISKFRVEEGKAWGSQRYVDSKAYRAYKSQGECKADVIRRPCKQHYDTNHVGGGVSLLLAAMLSRPSIHHSTCKPVVTYAPLAAAPCICFNTAQYG
eukprot:GHRR01033770.1.p2 GENE.GHRR01033770.1~~GHRR01033770.1.p2  ORF type:complete len:133 (+),score=24.05 GHRR01033770.1:403-801(+)